MDREFLQSGYDEASPFGDSRDGDFRYQQEGINASLFGKLRADAGRQTAAPIGNVVNAERLIPFSQRLTEGMTPEEKRRVPSAIYNAGVYGDMVQMYVPIASGTETLALPRPKNTRVLLAIQNPGLFNLYVSFDQIASTAGLFLPPNGNLFFDASVPQNDIHLFYGAAVDILIPVFYMNSDLARNVP